MRWLTLALLMLMAVPLRGSSPAEAVAAALSDARKLPLEVRQQTGYLMRPPSCKTEREWSEFKAALAFHFHSLSREPEIVPLVEPVPGIIRVYFDDYGWDKKVWEKMAFLDPYFHLLDPRVIRKVKLEVRDKESVLIDEQVKDAGEKVFVFRNGFVQVSRSAVREGEEVYEKVGERSFASIGRGPGGARGKQAQTVEKEKNLQPELDPKKTLLHAPWLDARQITELAGLLDSNVPIVRADWFVYQTGGTFRRGGAGYYDFLGLKSLKDVEKLAGLDVKAAQRLRLEMAALVDDSGVALNNRQILWFKTLSGSWWQTLDADESVGKKNALRLYDGDFEADAFEIYFSLPSKTWGLAAVNAKDGSLQDTVPDSIASNHQSPSNDKRIQSGFSCIECHVEGIRSIDDWARATFTGPVALASRDPKKYKRLKQLYLSDLPEQVNEDNRVYARTLLKINGLTPEKNARTHSAAYRTYFDRRLSFEDQCREWACEPKAMEAALKVYASPGDADPVITAQLARIRRPMRREHFEEVYGLGHAILRSARP